MKKNVKKKLTKQERIERRNNIIASLVFGFLAAIVAFFVEGLPFAVVSFVGGYIVIYVFIYFKKILDMSARIKKAETVFPDFLQLMASNLRAGMTIDKALLMSSRPEFDPLDKEIILTGKDITTGTSIENALLNLSKRLKSDKIHKTILLIISGIRSGGDLSILLEETAVNMREKEFIEKKSASSVLMYVIFIFLAVAIFAPALFSLSNVLVEVLTNILSGLPEIDASAAASMPFSMSAVSLSINFVKYFSLGFIVVIDILSCLVLGLVGKGEEKQGLKYLPVMLVLSVGIFFGAKAVLSTFISSMI